MSNTPVCVGVCVHACVRAYVCVFSELREHVVQYLFLVTHTLHHLRELLPHTTNQIDTVDTPGETLRQNGPTHSTGFSMSIG